MEAALIVGIVFFSLVAMVKLLTDWRTRRHLIEKGVVDERVKQLFGISELSVLSNLKWGMVLIGVGLASFLSRWLPYYMDDEGTIGLILIFAGLAFLIYFPIAQKKLKDVERSESRPVS